jgi:hypothetical protein
MQDEVTPQDAPRRPRHFWRLVRWLLSGAIGLGILAGTLVVLLSGSTVQLPGWVSARMEASVNSQIGPARIGLGGMEITFRQSAAPVITMTALRVFDANGRFIAWVPRSQVSLDRGALLEGRISPRGVFVDGLRMNMVRETDGSIELALGQLEGTEAIGGSPAAILDQLDAVFNSPGIEFLQAIEAQNVSLVLNDKASGRQWNVSDGELRLERAENGASLRVGFDTVGHQQNPAKIAVSVATRAENSQAVLAANVENISAVEIAAWDPSLSWLGLLQAPVAGSLRLGFSATGAVDIMNAALDIEAGFARIPGTERAIGIDRGRAYFGFRPETQTVEFDEISISTSEASFVAEGRMFVQPQHDITPAQLIAQLQFRDVTLSPAGFLDQPARFSGGGVDLRLQLDPFRAQIGQVSLVEGDQRFLARGTARADDGQFVGSVDISLNEADHHNMLALWPRNLSPKVRDWVQRNITSGRITDATAAIRTHGTNRPKVALGFQFDGATIRYMPKHQPIVGAAGYGA